MRDILEQISYCIQRGKINLNSPYPADLKGREGAVELTAKAFELGFTAAQVLNEALMPAMKIIGEKFRDNKIFVPDVLISAKAMNGAMTLLKPYFAAGEVKHRGTIVLGTVKGDLHDIGKNIVSMVLEGGGWQIIDIGVDASAEKFIEAIKHNNAKFVGLSALLTTTMLNMEEITSKIKSEVPAAFVIIGGAPVSKDFADKIGADCYAPTPQEALEYLNSFG